MQWPSVFSEPAVADPPRRVWRDWLLIAAVVVGAIVQPIVQPDIPAPLFSALACIALVPTVLWRRTRPVEMTYIAFVGFMTENALVRLTTGRASELSAAIFVLVLPYAVFRWGSGRAMAATIPLLVGAWIIGSIVDESQSISDVIGGAFALSVPCGLGLLVRYRVDAQTRLLDDARSRERLQLARDLHDSVAHHVSAIVVQAQAGQAVAVADPDAATAALARIESTAAQTLAEMRSLVGALRSPAALAPQATLADITALASAVPDDIAVTARVDTTSSVSDPVQSAVYRIAQEAITNAARHGRSVRHIDVEVATIDDVITVSVRNDGGRSRPPGGSGYGLIGMAERAHQFGGSFEAGPLPTGGWHVVAAIPSGSISVTEAGDDCRRSSDNRSEG